MWDRAPWRQALTPSATQSDGDHDWPEDRAGSQDPARELAELRRQRQLLAQIIDNAPIGEAIVAPDGSFVRVNDALCEIVGYSEAELLGMSFRQITHGDDLSDDLERMRRLLAGEIHGSQAEKRYLHKRGGVIWCRMSAWLLRDEAGQPLYFIAQIEDISERRLYEQRLVDRERQLAAAQALAQLGSWEWDLSQPLAQWSDELCRIFGLPIGSSPTREEFLELVHPDDRPSFHRFLEQAQTGAECATEYRVVRPGGEIRYVQARHFARLDENGAFRHRFGTAQDITGRKLAELELRRARDYSDAIIAAMREGYGLIVGGTLLAVNDALCELTGFSREELIGASAPFAFWPPELQPEISALVKRVTADGGGTFELMLQRKDGSRFDAEITARLARNPDGSALGFVNTVRDISERKRHEGELRRLATHDPLTGLPNHRVFHERLRDEVARAERHRRPLSLVLLDLDGFKQINDRHGHLIGDSVLQEVAARLTAVTREHELLGRVGGEEFAWILPDTIGADAVAAAERARRAISGSPVAPVGKITMSAGICELADAGDHRQLYDRADRALYRAKRQGRDRTIRFCEHSANRRDEVRARRRHLRRSDAA